MSLTWKDAVATILVGVVALITYARLKGFDWPLIDSWRMGSLALLIIGLGTCIIVGSGITSLSGAWMTTASILGGIALVLAIVGIAANSKIAFVALAINIVLLWIVATMHHTLTDKV